MSFSQSSPPISSTFAIRSYTFIYRTSLVYLTVQFLFHQVFLLYTSPDFILHIPPPTLLIFPPLSASHHLYSSCLVFKHLFTTIQCLSHSLLNLAPQSSFYYFHHLIPGLSLTIFLFTTKSSCRLSRYCLSPATTLQPIICFLHTVHLCTSSSIFTRRPVFPFFS